MDEPPDPDDLADRVSRLEAQLADLKQELQNEQRSRTSPLPSPRDILRVTDEHAIPGIIALLEAHIHALRLLQRTIRLLDPGGREHTESPQSTFGLDTTTAALTKQLDRLVTDLNNVASDTQHDAIDRLVDEAASIRTDLQAVSEGDEQPSQGSLTDAQVSPTNDTHIDIEEELRDIKSELSDNSAGTDTDHDDSDEDDASS